MYPNDKGGEKLGHPEEEGHGCLLYEQTQKVLLTIKDEGVQRNYEESRQVELTDIFPTLTQLFGIPTDHPIDGRSLIQFIRDKSLESRVAYSETFFPEELKGNYDQAVKPKKMYRLNNRYKVILEVGGQKVEIFDLENDPNEIKNLVE
jgi:arylsulfatase A-like enzyme